MPNPKIRYRTISQKAEKMFKAENKILNKKLKGRYSDVIKDLNLAVHEHLYTTGNFVKFPYGLGYIGYVKSCNDLKLEKDENGKILKANRTIDWPKTKELGRYVYNLNDHTEGYIIRFYWNRRESRFPLHDCFQIKTLKSARLALGKYLKTSTDPNKVQKFLDSPKKTFYK